MSKILLKSKKQNIACKKYERYVTRSVTLPRIDKDELLSRAADNSGIRKGTIYAAADAICNEFKNFLLNGHSVELPLIGSFRFGVNAKVSETAQEAGADTVYRRKIKYVPNAQLKRQLQAVNLIGQDEDSDADESGDNNG